MFTAVSRLTLAVTCLWSGTLVSASDTIRPSASALASEKAFRGPVDVVIGDDERWAASVNELSSSVSLVDLDSGRVLDELEVSGRPVALARLGADELLVSCMNSGFVKRLRVTGGRLSEVASIQVGFQPLGLAVGGSQAFVGLQATGEIAEIDLEANRLRRRFYVGRWPRYLTLSPDASRLAVGLSGDSSIAVVDSVLGQVLYEEPISGGINIGQLRTSSDGSYVYFPWMVYRSNPITVGNIRRGWVLANRIARIRLDGPEYRQAISLDVPREAVADPHGLVLTADQKRLAVTSSGTHELLVYRLGDLPFIGIGGPGDLIESELLRDADLFYRIELGGRPMGLYGLADSRHVLVANHTLDCLQLVDLERKEVTRTMSLGSQPTDPAAVRVHRGMEIFYDAERSLDQWYSCHSCHLDGGSNSKAMDTWNDGTELTDKAVLPLAGVVETGPWTWHGWQDDLADSIQNSFVSTMQGTPATEQDIQDLLRYLRSLESPPSPFLNHDGSLSEQARRGKMLFEDSDVGCSECHSGQRFTDGLVHDVGMTRETDKYQGYNTPSLIGIYRKVRFLHDGRAKSLEDVLRKWHRPEEVGGGAKLNDEQLADLIAYLKSL